MTKAHVGLVRHRNIYIYIYIYIYVVVQLFEAMRYKPEGCGFKFQCGHWDFSSTLSFRPHYGPGAVSAFNRNEYYGYILGVKTAGA